MHAEHKHSAPSTRIHKVNPILESDRIRMPSVGPGVALGASRIMNGCVGHFGASTRAGGSEAFPTQVYKYICMYMRRPDQVIFSRIMFLHVNYISITVNMHVVIHTCFI